MWAPKELIVFVIILVALTVSIKGSDIKSAKESSNSTAQRSNAELVQDEIVADISGKLEQSLEKAAQSLDAKINANFEKMLVKLDQRKEELLTAVKDTLRNETKKLLEQQQQINDEQLDVCIACQCKPQEKPLPSTCEEALQLTANSESGIYKLYLPNSNLEAFEVFCLKDPDHGDAWALIQRRQDNSTDFYRNWLGYQRGFGSLNSNLWIGLDIIHAMTSAQPHELWVQLETFDGETAYAKYDSFAVGNETTKYKLFKAHEYSGTAGDALYDAAGRMGFSTWDNDNDIWANTNCAESYKAGFWFSGCADSNLNGPYLNEENKNKQGIFWYPWRGYFNSMKYTHMAIRPKK